MKKINNKEGFTLVEMVVALLILVMIIVSMDTVMDSSMRIYDEATFEADSASLAGILNTSLGDILRYCENVKTNEDDSLIGADGGRLSNADCVFTSFDYGIQDAYFYLTPNAEHGESGVLQMRSLRNTKTVELVNTGAYPDLAIKNFRLNYHPLSDTGGYFDISYTIFDKNNPERTKDETCVVRMMNAA